MAYLHDQILPEGTKIGVYEIKDVLRIGEFDILYRARNHHLKDWVLLQEYFPYDCAVRGDDGLYVEYKSSSDKENFEYGLKAFLDQAEILVQIEHPNIAPIENSLQFNGTAYLIINYPEATPLSELEQSLKSLTEIQLKSILISILHALHEIHTNQIVHGGIRPETVLLGNNNQPILYDFAAARLAIAAHVGKLTSELAAGYAPIELYTQPEKLGPATDFYALGATIYYCITHKQPIAAQDRICALSKNEPDPLVPLSSSLANVYSSDFLNSIDWMLRPPYQDRPQSAMAILAAIQQEQIRSENGPVSSEKVNDYPADSMSLGKKLFWTSTAIGLVFLTTVGLWSLQSGEKEAAELLNDKPRLAENQPTLQQNADHAAAGLVEQDNDSAIQIASESATENNIGIPSIDSTEILPGSDKQLIETPREPPNKLPFHYSQLQNNLAKENTGMATATPPTEAEETQSLVANDNPLSVSEKEGLPANPITSPVSWHLKEAEKAIEELRFTTPIGNNAYEHYQKVLAMEPDNVEARAGLQKMVDGYIQLIASALKDDQLKTAWVYLRRAEAILPASTRLRQIRTELAAKHE